jgi:hypothetical protein
MFRLLQGIICRDIISGAQLQNILPERLFMFFKPGVRKYRETGLPGDCMVYGGAKYLWVLGMEVVSCHFSGAYNPDVTPSFLGG